MVQKSSHQAVATCGRSGVVKQRGLYSHFWPIQLNQVKHDSYAFHTVQAHGNNHS